MYGRSVALRLILYLPAVHDKLREQVKQVALQHPTYGYRFLYLELRDKGEQVGLHRIRTLLGELGLNPPQPRKTRRLSKEVVPAPEWSAARRVQINATRLSLTDGTCWIYHVLDVESRTVLASKAVRSLSMQLAKEALEEGITVLRSLDIRDAVLVQNDGGSNLLVKCFKTPALSTARGPGAKLVKKVAWAFWRGLTVPTKIRSPLDITSIHSPRFRRLYRAFTAGTTENGGIRL